VIRVSADRDKCIGSGRCLLSAPDVFDQDRTELVVVLDETPPEHQRDAVQLAVKQCPVGAVSAAG
jgi:ferredoxin